MTHPSTTAFRLSEANGSTRARATRLYPYVRAARTSSVVSRAQPLAVDIVNRAEAVQDQAARCDAPVGGHRQDLVDPSLELAAAEQLRQEAAQCPIEIDCGS